MEFRKAKYSDVESILGIIRQAQQYLKECGVQQWQNNYPNRETIINDINNQYSYVLTKEHLVVGTVAISFDGEETYNTIYEGEWRSNQPFAVIHRIAVEASLKGTGLASEIITNIETMCQNRAIQSIRSDTHKDNKSMQRLLQKNGFQLCGMIYIKDGSERLAFEKLL